MALSFKNKKGFNPCAMIEGGEYHGQLVYICPDRNGDFDHLKMDSNAKLKIIPNYNIEREILYIPGASGSGKSYYAKQYMKEYKRLFPDRDLIVISKVDEDESIDELPLKRVNIEALVDNPFEMEDLKNCCVLLDDVDILSDKDQLKAVENLRNQILEIGRHSGTSAVTTTHNATRSGGKSITQCTEAHIVVIFPRSSVSYETLLKRHLGWDNKEIETIPIFRNNRALTLFRHAPQVIMTEEQIFPRDMLVKIAEEMKENVKQPITVDLSQLKKDIIQKNEDKKTKRLPGRPRIYDRFTKAYIHCDACDKTIAQYNISHHTRTKKHQKNMIKWDEENNG